MGSGVSNKCNGNFTKLTVLHCRFVTTTTNKRGAHNNTNMRPVYYTTQCDDTTNTVHRETLKCIGDLTHTSSELY